MTSHGVKITVEEAESVAIRGLQHIAGDHVLLQRFLALTGIDPQDLRDAATSRNFLSGVLDFFMSDEPTLLAFAASMGEDPSIVSRSRAVLSRGRDEEP